MSQTSPARIGADWGKASGLNPCSIALAVDPNTRPSNRHWSKRQSIPRDCTIVMLALVKLTLQAALEFLSKRALHLATAECARNAGALMAVVWIGRAHTQLFCLCAANLSTALLYLPAIQGVARVLHDA